MRLGIIIPNYSTVMHHVRMLEQTLKSIKDHEPSLMEFTYVIDDHSPIKDKEALLTGLHKKYGNKTVYRQANGGYSSTVNRGIEWLVSIKKVDTILTLNSDCEVLAPFQKIVEATFDHDPKITVIGGRLFYPSGRIQSAGQTVPRDGGVIEHYKNQYPNDDITSGDPRYTHSVTGAMQFFKVSAGLYDETFPMAYEDVEFCMRQWSEGNRVFYQPNIRGVHREGATRGRFPSARELVSIERFDEVRNKADITQHHKTINTLNAARVIQKRQ